MDVEPDVLEALLYDWHNHHSLKRQKSDVDYWLRVLPPPPARVLVLGAGTGRVAVPVARSGRAVVALDRSEARLARIRPRPENLSTLCRDFRDFRLDRPVDAAVMPYSSCQLVPDDATLRSLFQNVFESLSPSGSLAIDVSESFGRRESSERRRVLRAPCPEIGVVVEEWQAARRQCDHLELRIEFRSDETSILDVVERWYYHRPERMQLLLAEAGFEPTRIDRGYAGTETSHRLIYHAVRP